NTVLLGLGARREALGHLVHAPVTEEAGRLRPQWGLFFEGRERGRGVQRRDSPVETQVLRNRRESSSLQSALQRSVLAQELGCSLRPDARRARQLVRGVAAQRDEVGDLLRLDVVALANLVRADPGQLADAP